MPFAFTAEKRIAQSTTAIAAVTKKAFMTVSLFPLPTKVRKSKGMPLMI